MGKKLELDQNLLGVSIAVGSWCAITRRLTAPETVDTEIDRLKVELEELREPMKKAVADWQSDEAIQVTLSELEGR
jgi:hypothetical protein